MKKRTWLTGRMWVIAGITGTMLTAAEGRAEDAVALKGADAVIQVVSEVLASSQGTNANPGVASRQQFAADLARFTSNSAALPPAEAADAWLQLVDRYWALPKGGSDESSAMMNLQMMRYGRPASVELSQSQVFAAIPGPASWPLLETRIAARKADDATRTREKGLRVFALLLNQHWSAAVEALDDTLRNLPKDDDSSYSRDQLRQARRSVDRLAKDEKTSGMAAEFERLLDALTNAPAEEVRITIPELAGMVGTNEAARLIEKAVVIPNARLDVTAGPATRRLLKAAIFRHLDTLTLPQWQLVRGTDAVEYYEAMIKRFPPKSPTEAPSDEAFNGSLIYRRTSYRGSEDYELRAARINYMLGLLAADRQDEAIRLAKDEDLDCSSIVGRHREGNDLQLPAIKIFRFAQILLQQKPDARVWSALVSSGMEADRDADVLAAISAPQAPLPDLERQLERDSAIAAGYLALDRVDDALALIRRQADLGVPGTPERTARAAESARCRALQQWVELGCVLGRQDLVDEACALILKRLNAPTEESASNEYRNDYSYDDAVNHLILSARYRQAEDLAIVLLRKALRAPAKTRRGYGEEAGLIAPRLAMLAGIYGAAGRSADVLTLFEKAPWWGAEDLLATSRYSGCDRSSLLSVAAAALLAQGRTNEAVRIAQTYLFMNPGDDEAYAVLAAAAEPGTLEWLDRLYARDRFEERPLIWKAVLLLKAGRIPEAEATIRAAIDVDPTDGETRAGDRVRAYAVLADVLEAQGKQKDATLFRNVVASVRLAEKGDALTSAGLVRRSIALYDEAAKLFADAYCVQWRLAERLYATGHPEEAEKHYEIVFQHMPEQFGRVAQLCFGCEGVFDRTQSRTVAERILSRLATNATVRPQVFYLIGQLREAQGRYPEAYEAFRKAVGIDHDYLDGWLKISEIAEQVAIPQSERDAIYLRMLSLDPLCCHSDMRDHITNLKGLWEAVAANRKLAWDPPKTLWPLPASKVALEKKRTAAQGAGIPDSEERDSDTPFSFRRMPQPGEAVVSTSIIAQTLQALWAGER